MPSSLFDPDEIEEIHAQIAQLRAETMRLSTQTNRRSEIAFHPVTHFWQTAAIASCFVLTVSAITIGITRFCLQR